MTRSLRVLLLCLGLAASPIACTPRLVGPTAPSGAFFSLRAVESTIWLRSPGALSLERFPRLAELLVRVQDAQGQPLDGVAVTFEVEPGWVQSATLTPSHTHTRQGMAQAVLEPKTTGNIRVMARVDNLTEVVSITVLVFNGASATSAD
jgi:hypothetical protein